MKRGTWRIILIRGRGAQTDEAPAPPPARNEVIETLKARGVTGKTAADLVGSHPPERIQTKVEVFDWLMKNEDKRVGKNPAGYLVASIRADYQAPGDYPSAATDPPAPSAEARKGGKAKTTPPAPEPDPADERERVRDVELRARLGGIAGGRARRDPRHREGRQPRHQPLAEDDGAALPRRPRSPAQSRPAKNPLSGRLIQAAASPSLSSVAVGGLRGAGGAAVAGVVQDHRGDQRAEQVVDDLRAVLADVDRVQPELLVQLLLDREHPLDPPEGFAAFAAELPRLRPPVDEVPRAGGSDPTGPEGGPSAGSAGAPVGPCRRSNSASVIAGRTRPVRLSGPGMPPRLVPPLIAQPPSSGSRRSGSCRRPGPGQATSFR